MHTGNLHFVAHFSHGFFNRASNGQKTLSPKYNAITFSDNNTQYLAALGCQWCVFFLPPPPLTFKTIIYTEFDPWGMYAVGNWSFYAPNSLLSPKMIGQE
jgi:hypothetical protein